MIGIVAESERGGGAVSVPMAVMLLALLAVIGLGVDGVRAAQGLARADAIAEEAARAAGQALDPRALHSGDIALDPARAVEAAQAYLAAAGTDGTVTVAGPRRVRVHVRITRPTVLLGLVGRPSITSEGTAEADVISVPPNGEPP